VKNYKRCYTTESVDTNSIAVVQCLTPTSHDTPTAVHTLRRIIFQRKRSASKTA